MKGRLAIFITVALMLVILVALNAASYVRVEDEVLSEFNPNRSTFNADATGTRAFYTFLEQSGHQVSRWGRPPAALLSGASAPANFVVVGKTRVDVESEDAEAILSWVEGGGRLPERGERASARAEGVVRDGEVGPVEHVEAFGQRL